jgi:pimeloyl-ACP methyl ester carboxylesterase
MADKHSDAPNATKKPVKIGEMTVPANRPATRAGLRGPAAPGRTPLTWWRWTCRGSGTPSAATRWCPRGATGEFIIAVADAFGLDHPHVVAPGTGTAAALFAAARHPGRLQCLVVGSGATAVPLQLGGVVKEITEAPDLDGFRRADPRELVSAAPSGISRYTMPEAVRDDYLASYQANRFAESVRCLRSYPAELPVLSGLLPQIDIPVQIIAGADDTTVPPVNAAFLRERLPHSKLDTIDAGHFTWEDAAAE